jgi:uncharacterized protein
MIVSFSVENFRSFNSEATLSLVASNRLAGEHGNHAITIPGSSAKVLRTAVIYGANGAGKSNLFKALSYLQDVATPFSGRDGEETGRAAFRFGDRSAAPSAFDLQFIAEERLYRYVIKLDDKLVTEEWLGETVDGRERMIFKRGQDRDVVLGDHLKAPHPRLVALATVGAAPNQSFLRTIGGSALALSDVGPELSSVQLWFWNVLDLMSPGEPHTSLWRKLNEDPSLLDFASGFLRSSSTGVDRLEILKSQISPEELSSFVGEPRARQLIDQAGTGRPRFIRARVPGDAWIEIGGSEGFRLVRFQSAHKSEDGRTFNMDLEDESDGTRRLLDLLPALHQMRHRGGVYFVDEIDRSMHPILVRRLLEFFLSSCADSPAQLIVTTHESNLLDLSLLRRDEIWFAEKDREQATHLYSLAEFQVRKDLEIRKHYLQGRFGAIPFLGNLEQLTNGRDETA